jgi:hypothetical protein
MQMFKSLHLIGRVFTLFFADFLEKKIEFVAYWFLLVSLYEYVWLQDANLYARLSLQRGLGPGGQRVKHTILAVMLCSKRDI